MRHIKLHTAFDSAIGGQHCTQFSLLTKEKDYYKSVSSTASSCRDNLLGSLVFGIQNKINLYDKKGRAAVLVVLHSGTYITRIKEILNYAESQLKVKQKTVFRTTKNPDIFVAFIDKFWLQRTYLLSLWALLCRIPATHFGQFEKYIKCSPQEFLNTYNADYWAYKCGSPNISCKDKYEFFVKNGVYISPDGDGVGSRYIGILSIKIPNYIKE